MVSHTREDCLSIVPFVFPTDDRRADLVLIPLRASVRDKLCDPASKSTFCELDAAYSARRERVQPRMEV